MPTVLEIKPELMFTRAAGLSISGARAAGVRNASNTRYEAMSVLESGAAMTETDRRQFAGAIA
jgi:hypothetical protein